jgi:hypothetical protein
MILPTFRALLPLATAFAACTVSFSSPALAAPFDGQWSVLIVTRSGPCDQAYRVGVTIQNGVVYGGGANLSGRVTNSGSVSVAVSSGRQTAYGYGRLSRNSGGGSWRGSGPTGSCSGNWSATRSG